MEVEVRGGAAHVDGERVTERLEFLREGAAADRSTLGREDNVNSEFEQCERKSCDARGGAVERAQIRERQLFHALRAAPVASSIDELSFELFFRRVLATLRLHVEVP